jgi:hypothetical protein
MFERRAFNIAIRRMAMLTDRRAAMDFTHRAKKGEKYALWGSLVFLMALMIAFFSFVPQANPDAPISKLPVQLLVSPLFLIPILLSLTGVMQAMRYCLHLTDGVVEKTGILPYRSIQLDYVIEASWRLFGSRRGQIVLRTPAVKVAVTLSDFSREETRDLVRFFRDRFPTSIQTGWDKYWEQNWPMFDEWEALSPEEIAAARRASRRVFFWWSLCGWIAFVVGDLFAWRYTGETKWLWQPLLPTIGLAFVVYFFPKHLTSKTRGRIGRTRPRPKISKVAVLCFLAAYVLPILVMTSRILPHNSVEEAIAIFGTMALFIVPLILDIRRQNRPLKAWNCEAAKLAAELYLKSPVETPKPTP